MSITPTYAFPVLSATNAGEIVAWERRTYGDVVTFSVVPEPSGLMLAAAAVAACWCGSRIRPRDCGEQPASL